ncbi:TetR/AcrR family transcriptional regulator [Saccharopolyspora sp. NPDC000359]|uniref:TetR/AcrR family transcriptional regulator n=1 Tax=Saccharopolyspora sp. NPDC000359 TaxID=3154251 RepID=UPI00331FC24B
MGNREDLLTAAMECLRTKGYARTTARDITERAGTSLAAIGYHYGGIRNLLNEAVHAALEQWSDAEHARLRDAPPDETFLERFGAVWARTIENVRADRGLWAASFELMSQVDHVPELREQLRRAVRGARTGNVAMFDGVDEDTVSDEEARSVGALYYAIQAGVVMQWLIDPDGAPKAEDLVAGLRAIAAKAVEEG